MNLLMTMNCNNYLSNNARSSLSAAAERWKCEYLEVKEQRWPSIHPCFSKLAFLAYRSGAWDRIVYADGDMLIRSDAPSPFDLCPSHLIGCVNDVQTHYNEKERRDIEEGVHRPYYPMIKEILGEMPVTEQEFMKQPFNAGFIIFTPKLHAPIMQRCCEGVDKFVRWDVEKNMKLAHNSHVEQAFFNIFLTEAGVKYQLDNTWNRIGPDITIPTMQDYVYHFTGMDFWKKRDIIKYFPWQAPTTKL